MIKRLLALTLVLPIFLTSATWCADVQKGGVYELSDFSGGIDSKTSAFSLPANKATIAENARFNSPYKGLSKRTNLRIYGSADSVEAITGMSRFYKKNGDKVLVVTHGDEVEKGSDTTGVFTNILNLTTGNHKWQFVTWHDILIGCDGYNQPIKYDGSSASATYLGSCLATDAGSGSGPATGLYSYKVAFYSTSYTVILNVPSNTITANGNDVTLTMIPIAPDTLLNGEATIGRKIYRTESGGSTYKLLSNGTIANNTAVTLTDSDADAALGASYPAGDATWTPPKGRFCLVQNNRLFFANDPTNSPSRVWYGEDASHDVFINDQYKDIRQNDGDSITFMKGNLGLLTIGKNNTIQKIYIDGDDPVTDWKISDPLSYVGCQAPYSVDNSPLGIIYLARDGIYRFNGQYSELISESVTPTIKDISATSSENVSGIYHDNFYYLSYQSKQSGEAFNNRVLVLDVLAKAYSIDILSINAFTSFNSGNDWGILYAGSSANGSVYAYADEVNEIVHKRHSDFAGLWDDVRYIPTGIPGGDSESPVLEIARTETINDLSGTINDLVGAIDRQDVVGHYVSRSIFIGASNLDKIYWNSIVPGTGSVTFQVRTSPTGENNLLLNDDFEFWDNWVTGTPTIEQPNDFTYAQDGTGGSANQSTTEVKRGTYSCKITKSDSGQSYVWIPIQNPTNYRSKTLAFSGWAKSANSVASKVRFQITDGTSTTTANYANGGGWEELQGTIAVAAGATAITFKAVVETGADAVAYFDNVMVVEASDAVNDWSAWSTAVTNSSGSDISGVTANTYIQYLANLTTSDIALTPTIVKAAGYNIRLTYGREGTAASTDIPLRWRSGWLDMGQPTKPKSLRSMEIYHTGTSGILNIKVENFQGDSDTFAIDLSAHPSRYKQAFTNGVLGGKQFVVDITSTGILPVSIEKIVFTYDVEPDQGDFT